MNPEGPTILTRDFQADFTVNWMLHDLDLVYQQAQRNEAQLPAIRWTQELSDLGASGCSKGKRSVAFKP